MSKTFYAAFLFATALSSAVVFASDKMVSVPAGSYVPFYPDTSKTPAAEAKKKPVQVKSFFMDVYPVTRGEFLGFVKRHPEWRKSQTASQFADKHYLENWQGELNPRRGESLKAPVTYVSWFAAEAYCESKGKTLPTNSQWEYAAYDNGRNEREVKDRVLQWFSRPNDKKLPPVGSTPKNGFGLYDLQGLVWEWTYDFNSGEGGGGEAFCGAGSLDASKASDYVNFMRHSFRGSLKGEYTTANLGFRCAKTSAQNFDTEWTDQNGKKVKLSDFAGHPVVIAMIYTSCQMACPITVSDMTRIQKALSPKAQQSVKFVVVSFDPERDTPEKLLQYEKAHGLEGKNWEMLNGSDDQVRKLSALLDVKYKKLESGDFRHSSIISILNSEGFVEKQKEGLRQDPADLVNVLNKMTSS